jgi:hypothetical protein
MTLVVLVGNHNYYVIELRIEKRKRRSREGKRRMWEKQPQYACKVAMLLFG